MRINKYLALATNLSRRQADTVVENGRVTINGQLASLGSLVELGDTVRFNNHVVTLPETSVTIMFNKPVGYVCSRDGQGSPTVYQLLPKEYQRLQTIGRLDKDSSGLVLLTNDGELAHRLTHPSFHKQKVYLVELAKDLASHDAKTITGSGVRLDDGPSRLHLAAGSDGRHWQVTMYEGRNRQIRRTFEALGYDVRALHRIQIGDYHLDQLQKGEWQER